MVASELSSSDFVGLVFLWQTDACTMYKDYNISSDIKPYQYLTNCFAILEIINDNHVGRVQSGELERMLYV